jgi:hypothetical protein
LLLEDGDREREYSELRPLREAEYANTPNGLDLVESKAYAIE